MPIDDARIRSTLMILMERDIEARVLLSKDSAAQGRFALDSPHLRTLLGVGAAVDGVKAAWVALRRGEDPLRTLSYYAQRYFPSPGANEGIPEACDEISAIVKRWEHAE